MAKYIKTFFWILSYLSKISERQGWQKVESISFIRPFGLNYGFVKVHGRYSQNEFPDKKLILFSFSDLSKSNKTIGSSQIRSKYLIIKRWFAVTQLLDRCAISKRYQQRPCKIPPVLA